MQQQMLNKCSGNEGRYVGSNLDNGFGFEKLVLLLDCAALSGFFPVSIPKLLMIMMMVMMMMVVVVMMTMMIFLWGEWCTGRG